MPSLGDVGRHVGQHRFERAVEPAHEEAVLVRRPDAAAVGARSPYNGRPRLRAIRAWRARGRFVGLRPRGRIGHGISSRVVNSSSTPERAGPAAVASRRRSRSRLATHQSFGRRPAPERSVPAAPNGPIRALPWRRRARTGRAAGDEAGPPGLVAGAEAGAVVAVEVLVEQDQVAPVRIVLELGACRRRPAAGRRRRAGTSPTAAALISFATSNSVMRRPEPVGHSTVNSSP